MIDDASMISCYFYPVPVKMIPTADSQVLGIPSFPIRSEKKLAFAISWFSPFKSPILFDEQEFASLIEVQMKREKVSSTMIKQCWRYISGWQMLLKNFYLRIFLIRVCQ